MKLENMLCLKCGGHFAASLDNEIIICPYCGRRIVATEAVGDYTESRGIVAEKPAYSAVISENQPEIESDEFEIAGEILKKYHGNSETVIIPESVKVIGTSCFFGNTSVKTIVLHDEVKKIANIAFDGCRSLSSINLPASIESLGALAFKDCVSLLSVEIPGSIQVVGDDAFSGCTKLRTVKLGVGVKMIGARTFYECRELKSVEFPATLTTIGRLAFAGAASLENVILPDGLELVDDNAFSGCTSIGEARLPLSIKKIGKTLFDDCKINKIYMSKGLNVNCLSCGQKTVPVFSGKCRVCGCEYVFTDEIIKGRRKK